MPEKRPQNNRLAIEEFQEGFPWGKVVAVHTIGEYDIVEYKRWTYENGSMVYPRVPQVSSSFHPYINGKDTHRSFDMMEKALVGAIAYRYDGCNSQAGSMFERMTQIDNAAHLLSVAIKELEV